jgi:hypothetical protein
VIADQEIVAVETFEGILPIATVEKVRGRVPEQIVFPIPAQGIFDEHSAGDTDVSDTGAQV